MIYLLSIVIFVCKIISFVCLMIAVFFYRWFQIENVEAHQDLIHDLCLSYGAFCNRQDQMPLPRLIVILPCVLAGLGLSLEILNLLLLSWICQRVRSIVNFCLEQTSIALSCAITIHCLWVSAVYLRISMELGIVQLHWPFFAFVTATILTPLDAICSISRMINNCQYEKVTQASKRSSVFSSRQKSIF